MSKKHFERFAVAVALIADDVARDDVRDVIEDVCRDGNARFDLYRFRQAIETLRRAERPAGFSAELFNSWRPTLLVNAARVEHQRATAGRKEVQP